MAKQSAAERLITLTCCLVAAPVLGLSKQQLMQSVAGYQEASSQEAKDRMFERDKLALRDAGVQLEVLDGDGSDDPDATRYRIQKGVFDWPKDLKINGAKLALLELAARSWNQSAMQPSAQGALLRLRSLGLVQAEQLDMFSPRILARHAGFAPLATAIEDEKQVVFDYQKPTSASSRKTVSPLKLRLIQGQWVLLAADRGQIKNYLLRRIVSKVSILELSSEKFSQQDMLAAEQDLVQFAEGQRAVLEITPDSEAHWHFGAPIEPRLEVSYMDRELFVEDLLEFGGEVEVIEPQELRDYINQRLEAVIAAHA
jgi:proteasome accessory factor B